MKALYNIKTLQFVDKFFIFWVVVCSGTLISQQQPVLYGLIFSWFLLISKNKVDSLKKICPIVGLLTIIWMVQLYYFNNINDIVVLLKNILVLLATLSYFSSKKHLIKSKILYFLNLTFVFSLISTALFVLMVIGINLPTTSINEMGDSRTFLYLMSYSANPFYGFLGYRNYGIYWEPGMYQVYLCFLLIFLLNYNDSLKGKRRYGILAYLVFLIITTGSVTGYAMCAFIIGFYLIKNNNKVYINILMMLVFVVGVVFALPRFEDMVETKQTVGNSYIYRTLDFFEAINISKNSPIIGHGFVNHAFEIGTKGLFDDIRGSSNGVGNILLNFGLVGFITILILLIKCSYVLKRYFSITPIVFLLLVLIGLMSEPFHQHPFFYMLLGIGVCEPSKSCKSGNQCLFFRKVSSLR